MIYVVRHGQTDWNKRKVMQGQTDIPLNEEGKRQALALGKKLQTIKFDITYCSPLKRAVETFQNLSVKSDRIVFDDRLKERNYGEFENRPKNSFDYNEFWSYTLNKKYAKAEACKEFFKRIFNFLEEIKDDYKDKDILIVTHAGVMKVFKCYLDGFLKDEEIGPFLPNNSEVLTYQF